MRSSQTMPCRLGPLELAGLEVPSVFERTGVQRTVVHRLLGGGRVVQTFGPDPVRRVLRGTFFGTDATERAQLLEVLRDVGEPLELTIGAWTELVILTSATIRYQARGALIPYVVEAETLVAPIMALEVGLTQIAGGIAGAIGAGIASLAGLGSVAGVVGTSVAAGTSGLAAALAVDLTTDGGRQSGAAALGGAAAALSLGIASSGATLASLASSAGGGLVAGPGSLAQAAASAGSQAGLVQSAGYVNQAGAGLAALDGGGATDAIHS